MITPDYFDAPLAIEPTVRDEVTVNLESDGITSPEYMRLVEPNGNEILIPVNLIPAIIYTGNGAMREMVAKKEEAKMLSNHPSHFAALDFVNGSNRRLVLEATSASVELTPLISWIVEKDLGSGWQLTIVGAAEVKLIFVQWDNVDGIKKMVETIKSPKSLFAMVALINPILATRLSSRATAVSLKKSRSIPKMEIKDIRKIIEDANLGSAAKNTWSSGGLGNLPIKINDKQVRIAIKVRPPHTPAFAPAFVKDAKMEYKDVLVAGEAHNKAANREWQERFKEAIRGTDWRIIRLQDPAIRNYRNDLNDFWITRIPEKEWASLETAAKAEIQNTNGTSAKF